MLFNCLTRFEIFYCLSYLTILEPGGSHMEHGHGTGVIDLNGRGKVLDGQIVIA